MFSRRDFLLGSGAFVAATGLAGSVSAAALKPHALDDFFASPKTRGAALSPSGSKIAILHGVGDDQKNRQMTLDVLDAADPGRTLHRVPLGPNDAHRIEWASEDRLLVWVDIPWEKRTVPYTGSRMGSQLVEVTIRRLMAINADGSDPVLMFNDSLLLKSNFNLARLIDTLPDDPDHVMMMAWDAPADVWALYKVNILTGDAVQLERGKARTRDWKVHKGVPILRYDANPRWTVESIHARAPGETEWKLLRKQPLQLVTDFAYVGPTDDPTVIRARLKIEGEDSLALAEIDLRTFEVVKKISSRPGSDVVGGLLDERRAYMGAKYIEDRVTYDFADPALAKHFAGVNAFLGNECNVEFVDVDAARNRFLARASGPREPGAYIYYDKAAKRLEDIGGRYPGLQPERLAPMSPVRVKTRDGAEITAYLTAPLSGAPGPLVVLVHGGPAVRDHLAWDRQVQVLAAQGWWVLQPNFRGSAGYGQAFEQAGHGRWGDRMQEDVEDAIAQVVAEKKLDAKRVAIMGTSYGGYAALMGAVRRPDLYKAAISICGVSDLIVALDDELAGDDTPAKEIYKLWVERIGDPKTEGDKIRAASPRRRAAEIQCPVLLVHGEEDSIVPIAQSQIMLAALKSAGKAVEFVEVPNAGHGDWKDEEEKKLMVRYVALLEKAFA